MTRSLALGFYLGLSRLADWIAPFLLRRRLARGKEHPERWRERLGEPSLPRPDGEIVWLHGASVGEALSLLPLIRAIIARRGDLGILVTTGTVTSAMRVEAELPEGVLHQFAPVDTCRAVRRFLDHWRPTLAVRVESELWPRLITETRHRDIPQALVNARLSERSARRWGRMKWMAQSLVCAFDCIVTQDRASADRLVTLGAPRALVRTGVNLKMLAPPPAADPDRVAGFRDQVAGRPVWLAASTHDPEERIVAEAHALLAADLPAILTVLAPRHPARGPEIAALLREAGHTVALRSRDDALDEDTDIYIADTLGEMGLWLRVAPVSFIGGSLAPMGGHNPFEPAALGCAVIHGPEVANFAPAYSDLRAAAASLEVTDAASLAAAVGAVFTDPSERRAMTARASAVFRGQTGDLETLTEELLRLMRTGGPARRADERLAGHAGA